MSSLPREAGKHLLTMLLRLGAVHTCARSNSTQRLLRSQAWAAVPSTDTVVQASRLQVTASDSETAVSFGGKSSQGVAIGQASAALLFPMFSFSRCTSSKIGHILHLRIILCSRDPLCPVTRNWCCSSTTSVRPAVGLRSWRLEVGHSGAAATSQPMTQQAGG